MTLKIYHNDWFLAIVEGDEIIPCDTQLAAHACAKARGYRFDRLEKDGGQVVEIWRKK